MILCLSNWFHAVPCEGSVVLTQTHPAAPYVCRTGNITLRCQYDGVENVFGVLWVIGGQTTSNPSTIPRHTALPRTTTYQEVVVDSYTNIRERYQCAPVLLNGTTLDSNEYEVQIECKLSTAVSVRRVHSRAVLTAITEDVPTLSCAQYISIYTVYLLYFLCPLSPSSPS